MDRKDFVQKIKRAIAERLGGKYQVRIQEVRKNNGIIMEGLMIFSENHNVSPTIYLNHFWEAYQEGAALKEIAEEIVRIYTEDTPGRNIDMEFFKHYDRVKERVCFRLISAEKNKELLREIPHIPFLDLAISFYYAYQGKDLGGGSILIHNSHLEMWEISKEELFHCSKDNTPRLFPWECRTMEEVLSEFQKQREPERVQNDFSRVPPFEILSNSARMYGAACILYPGVLEELAERARTHLFLIPSSVHEMILLPDQGQQRHTMLREMIREVNAAQAEPEEILSDKLYYYDYTEKCTKIVS